MSIRMTSLRLRKLTGVKRTAVLVSAAVLAVGVSGGTALGRVSTPRRGVSSEQNLSDL
jgi:hypothetical protein